jgi:hypothetical protein
MVKGREAVVGMVSVWYGWLGRVEHGVGKGTVTAKVSEVEMLTCVVSLGRVAR